MSELNWAEQARAILDERDAVLKEYAKIRNKRARELAEAGLDDKFKQQLRGIIGYPPQMWANTVTTSPNLIYGGKS